MINSFETICDLSVMNRSKERLRLTTYMSVLEDSCPWETPVNPLETFQHKYAYSVYTSP